MLCAPARYIDSRKFSGSSLILILQLLELVSSREEPPALKIVLPERPLIEETPQTRLQTPPREVPNPQNPSKSLIFGRFRKIVVSKIRFRGATLGPHSGHKYLKSRNSMWRLAFQSGAPKVLQKWGPRWVPPHPLEGSSSRLDAIFSLIFASRGTFSPPDSRHRLRHVVRQLNLG